MNSKKEIVLSLLIIFLLIYSGLSYFTDLFIDSVEINVAVLLILIIVGIWIIHSYLKRAHNNLNAGYKLVDSIINSIDTVYIMISSKTKKVVYLSNTSLEILGINEQTIEDTANKILNVPVIKKELNNIENRNGYTSQMLEYDNPKYNYPMWIRVKISKYTEKKDEYYIIQIIDSTKEHDQQHLLITQATDIKSRESILNQITAKSYDFEININVNLNNYDLKYYKKDNLYFGDEKRGNYKEDLAKLLEYVNEHDRKLVYDNLNIDRLKEHFIKYELDSVVIRYRIGNEIKNNTWLESTIFFLIDRGKNNVSILTKNVTESLESIREQNVMLQNALNDAKRSSKSKTELISAISHDIRTPLTNIVGLSESLLGKDMDSSIKEDIKNINDSSNEVIDIIDELLDTTKIEKKLIEKEEKNYSLLRMFKKVENNAKEYIGNKNIKLNINLDNNLPVILYGDFLRITKAINEIVNNSIKYTNEGEITVNVRGEKISKNVKLIVEVTDTGIGIEEKKLKDIMNNDNNKGIDTVKKLISLLDGKLEIESKVGKYTKVTLSFMQKIVEDNKVRELIDNNKKAEEFSLKGKKVLVVDDNKLNLKVTKRFLESYDLDITLIESGEECIDLVKENNNFDLIFMDQMMPGLSGLDTMNKLKELDNFKTPIVVLTADAIQGQKEKYLVSGFADYISKPIDKSELSRVLKKFLKDN